MTRTPLFTRTSRRSAKRRGPAVLAALALTATALTQAAPARADEPAPTTPAAAPIVERVFDPGVGLVGVWQWMGQAWQLVGVENPPTQQQTPTQPPATSTPPTGGQATAQIQAPATTGKAFTGQALTGSLTTERWPGRDVKWIVATPAGTPKGTVIVLHGKTDTAQKAHDELGLAELAKSSGWAFAAIDGDSTYWTNYRGVDTGAMVVQDFLPLLAKEGLPVDRVALTGYSMGGLGALLLAEQLGVQKVLAVMPMSAAVWEGGHPGAEGQAQEQVRRDAGKLAGIPVRIVSGTDDGLTPVNQSLAKLIPHAQTEWTPGGHDFGYWKPALVKQIAWLDTQLAAGG